MRQGERPQGKRTLLTPWPWTCCLQNLWRICFRCLQPPARDLSKATEPADVEADSLPGVSITQHETDVVSWSLF